MMNTKQKEVFDQIIAQLQEKFPEVYLMSVEELGANAFWVTMVEPSDEERQLQFDDLQAELATDALVDYGFQFRFVPASIRKTMPKDTKHLQTA